MKRRNINESILITAVLTLVAVSLWIYLSVHRALNKPEKPTVSPKEVKMFNPTFDESVFEELKKRKN